MELYGRQFVASQDAATAVDGFVERAVFGPLRIRAHRLLPVTATDAGDGKLVALGHIIDPTRPAASNEDVLRSLAQCRTYRELESAMVDLSGRWLLFARLRSEARLYPDAGGSKAAFYGDGWVASQPALVGLHLTANLDDHPDACCWPMGEAPIPGAHQLLPNHYLDLASFRPVRFGPRAPVPTTLEEAVRVVGDSLQGTMAALVNRGSVALALTGGHDSRTLLSAASGVLDRIRLFSVHDAKTARHDRVIPPILARRLGRRLEIVKSGPVVDLRLNTGGLWRDENQHLVPSFAHPGFVVLGHMSEILPCFYWRNGVRRSGTPELFSRLAGLDGAFTDAYARWMSTVSDDTGIDLVDQFYWESRVGVWSSLTCTALDGYGDPISPYNCRRLIEAGLGLDVAFRREPYELHRRLCAPELRPVPFNETLLERWFKKVPDWVPWRLQQAFKRMTGMGR